MLSSVWGEKVSCKICACVLLFLSVVSSVIKNPSVPHPLIQLCLCFLTGQFLIYNSKIWKALKTCTFSLTDLAAEPDLYWYKALSGSSIFFLLMRKSWLRIPSSTCHLSQDLSHPWLLTLTLQTHWPTSPVHSSSQVSTLSVPSSLSLLSPPCLVTAFATG